MRQLPVAAVQQLRLGKGDKAECHPRWKGSERAARGVVSSNALLIRVTMDGGSECEEELRAQINRTSQFYARRRAALALQLAKLLDMKQTAFTGRRLPL